MCDKLIPSVAGFFTYARRRYKLMLDRAVGKPKPWTDDPILRNYRFCNVFREDDATTRYIKSAIRERHAKNDNLWFLLCIARWINRIETLKVLCERYPLFDPSRKLYQYKPAELMQHLEAAQQETGGIFTGAYMITNANQHCSKIEFVSCRPLLSAWNAKKELKKIFTTSRSLEASFVALRNCGMGWAGSGFMAYEVITDLRHTHYLSNARDIMTWANPGPGARRGLNRLCNQPLHKPMQAGLMLKRMEILLTISKLAEHWPQEWPSWEMRDIEHTLCEFDKYLRVQNGEGRPRSRYDGVGHV